MKLNKHAFQKVSLLTILTSAILAAEAGNSWQQQSIDWRQDNDQQHVSVRQQGIDISIEQISKSGEAKQIALLTATGFAYESACLHRDSQGLLYVFTVGEDGQGEQWLLEKNLQKVRSLALPPGAESCSVDDNSAMLYVNEPDIGVWAYPASAEAPLIRNVVDMVEPFGTLKSSGPLAAFSGGILVMDSKAGKVRSYLHSGTGWQTGNTGSLQAEDAEQLQWHAESATVSVFDDDIGTWKTAGISVKTATARTNLPVVSPEVETTPVGHHGDAADDPAIWVHPVDVSQSRILGTDKKGTLLVYDMTGHELQKLSVGRINNIDLRSHIVIEKNTIDLAAATQRDRNSILLFDIDRHSGTVTVAGEISTGLQDIYGICLYQPQTGEINAFVNGKSGEYLQYRLHRNQQQWQGKLLRRFTTETQPEGCVVDDRQHRLFFGEEDRGLWTISARADSHASSAQAVMMVNDMLVPDVEGVALYHGRKHSYLIISSQGNDSYLVLDATPPYRSRGAFRIGLNTAAGIDGASETDGLEVNSANFGGNFSKGILVVQDGRNRMPEETQNFKYVSWQAIANVLKLE